MGNTPFRDEWFENGRVDALEKWIEKNDVCWQNDFGNTVAHWSAWHNQPEMLNLCIQKGADLNALNKGANTPLHLASYRNSVACVEILLRHGADHTLCNLQGHKSSDIARLNRNVEVETALVEFLEGESKSTALDSEDEEAHPTDAKDPVDAEPGPLDAEPGPERGSPSIVPNEEEQQSHLDGVNIMRKKQGSNDNAPAPLSLPPSEKQKRKRKPWKDHWFEKRKLKSLERWLRRYDPDYQNEFGNTAAHWACWHTRVTMLEMIANAGASLNLTNKGKNTPLHLAAYRNSASCVRFLLQSNADVMMQNAQNQTALDVACLLEHNRIVEILQVYQADHGYPPPEEAPEEEDDDEEEEEEEEEAEEVEQDEEEADADVAPEEQLQDEHKDVDANVDANTAVSTEVDETSTSSQSQGAIGIPLNQIQSLYLVLDRDDDDDVESVISEYSYYDEVDATEPVAVSSTSVR